MFKLTRESYVPAHPSAVIRSKTAPAVVYLDDNTKPVAIGFYGKAAKPLFHHSFRTAESRAKYVSDWLASAERAEAAKVERNAARKAFRHTLKVGSLLYSTWGYDQTNVDFYEVTKLVGDTMVEIRKIAADSESTGYMSGTAVAVPGKYVGEATRHKVASGNVLCVRGDYGYAREYEAGRKIGWSSYH